MAPLVHADVGILGYSTNNHTFKCVDPDDGSELWSWRSTAGREPQFILVDHYVVMLGENGHLLAFDASVLPLRLIAESEAPILDAPCFTSPVVGQGRLIARNETHIVCCDFPQTKP